MSDDRAYRDGRLVMDSKQELVDEIERLRAALKPFAEAAKHFSPYPKKMEGASVDLLITLKELRQAASAYEQALVAAE